MAEACGKLIDDEEPGRASGGSEPEYMNDPYHNDPAVQTDYYECDVSIEFT